MPPFDSPQSFQDAAAVQTFLGTLKGGRDAYPVLVKALYRERTGWDQALARVAFPVARALDGRFAWVVGRVAATVTSPDGLTDKALWTAPDGAAFESVLIRHPSGRTTLCVSSQAGCALGCGFCATGRLGLGRDLGATEILEQAAWAIDLLAPRGERLTNVVFMGMGEPLLNPGAVGEALEGMTDQRRFEVAPRRICVSTSGITEAIEPFYRRFPRIKLALSLHAARQDLRDRLMPGCRRWPLKGLMEAMDRYAQDTGHKPFYEYVMAAGVNDGEREAEELAALLGGRKGHVNLIPCNTDEGETWRPSPRAVLDRFQEVLRAAGVASTVRHSAGEAIAAACGRLAGAPETTLPFRRE